MTPLLSPLTGEELRDIQEMKKGREEKGKVVVKEGVCGIETKEESKDKETNSHFLIIINIYL